MIRWIHLIRYPDGVDKEAADRWYVEVHSQEAKRMVTNGMVSYRTWRGLESPYASPYWDRERLHHWDRITELGFSDWDAFRAATAANAGTYTPPPYSDTFGADTLESHQIFLGDDPEHDFLLEEAPKVGR
jgi:hypothetical protein